MAMCTDQIVGAILSSWRYDISGIPREVRVDYEQHFQECAHCRRRQHIHRMVDVALAGITTLSALAFLLALAVIHRLEPLRSWALELHLNEEYLLKLHLHQSYIAITLQDLAIFGLLVSLVAWALVALVTPAPTYLTDVAVAQARVLEREWRNRGVRKAA
jgi:hypothetical protein